MKIGNNTNATIFRFRHNGKDLNFEITKEVRYSDHHKIEPSSMVKFEFDDMSEIRELVRMLEFFESVCKKSFGTWEIR